jgi:hypothetical protein
VNRAIRLVARTCFQRDDVDDGSQETIELVSKLAETKALGVLTQMSKQQEDEMLKTRKDDLASLIRGLSAFIKMLGKEASKVHLQVSLYAVQKANMQLT